MKKIVKYGGIVLVVVSFVIFGLAGASDVQAWYQDDCFALQYVVKREDAVTPLDPTNMVPSSAAGAAAQAGVGLGYTEAGKAETYSTTKICAVKNKDGKMTKLKNGGLPEKGKTNSMTRPSLSLSSDKKTLYLYYCSTGKSACKDEKEGLVKKTFNVSKYSSFEKLAQAVWDKAPNNAKLASFANDAEKVALKVNTNNDMALDELQKQVDEHNAEVSESKTEASGGNDNQSGDVMETCANQGGAQSLGWIVCPILTWIGNASDELYSKYVEPALQVDPKLFTAEQSNLEEAWGTFQNFANIIFVILLLFVIFSQLTGVGIDNYGIKKILPKLIVSAILINLSYVICMISIDLSNILGNAFQALFDGLADNLSIVDEIDIEGTKVGISSAKGTIASVAVLGSIVVAGGAMWKNPAIPMSLLVSAVGVLISIVFLFVLLSAREAAIIVLTVISPVAVVCYMLPNTKKFFDKWLKIFEGLLLVYPICGLLVGGGNYVSKLLLTSGFASSGFISAFTAMIAGVVPVFFTPMVLKSSFAAFGSIGSRLAGFGDRLGAGTTGKIRGTEGYKSLQQRGYQRKTRINAGLNADGSARRSLRNSFAGTRLGRAIGYQNLQGARIASARKAMAEDVESGAALGELAYQRHKQSHPEESDDDYYEELLTRAAASGNQNEIMTALAQMDRSNMQDSHKADVARTVLGNRANFGNMNAAQIRDTLENVGKQYGNGFLKKDFELKNYAMRGGVGETGAQNVDGWAQANLGADALKDEDVLALSTDRRAALMNDGIISQSQAQRVWASNANMDDEARLQMGAYGNSGIVMGKGEAQQAINPHAMGPTRLTREQIEAYTERAAGGVVIEDVRWRDKQGQHQQTDPLMVDQARRSRPDTNLGTGAGADGVSE